MSYDALFSPIKLRGLELKNRIVLPGMNTKMVKDKHHVADDMIQYHAARAAGGCGLNIVELVSICKECHAYLYFGLYSEAMEVRQLFRSGTVDSYRRNSSIKQIKQRHLIILQ